MVSNKYQRFFFRNSIEFHIIDPPKKTNVKNPEKNPEEVIKKHEFEYLAYNESNKASLHLCIHTIKDYFKSPFYKAQIYFIFLKNLLKIYYKIYLVKNRCIFTKYKFIK